MKKLVIFDLDGTLLNTIADLGSATNYAMQQMGYPTHDIDSYRYMVGNGITRLIERALSEDKRGTETVEKAREYFLEYYGEHCVDRTEPYPGIPELLANLVAQDIKVAVASNKYHAATTRLIGHFFPDVEWAAVEGHRPGRPTKPDPAIVEAIMKKAGVEKQKDVLYVGDSGVDMDTAHNAGIESVGVTWGFRPAEELREHGARHIVGLPAGIFGLAEEP